MPPEPVQLHTLCRHAELPCEFAGELRAFNSSFGALPAAKVCLHSPTTDAFISKGILARGEWASVTNERTRKYVITAMAAALKAQPGSIFVDAGANLGTFSLQLLAAGFRGILVEAYPPNAKLLQASICRNGHEGRATLHAPLALTNGSSTAPVCMAWADASNSGTSAVSACAHGSVPVSTLDAIASDCPPRAVSAFKLDVEKSELDVLRGASLFLRRCRPRDVFVEDLHGGRVVQRLKEDAGYRVRRQIGAFDFHLVAHV